MKIALIGYGKMGKTIEVLGKQQGHSFPVIIDEHSQSLFTAESFMEIDTAIEFSRPEAAPGNITRCMELGVPVVSGTTGWNEKIPEIEAYCMEQGGTLFHASNFSVGVNILFSLNRKLAEIMAHFPEYKVSMKEVHHTQKLDAPSGTAITLAEQIMEHNDSISSWYLEGSMDEPGNKDAYLPIKAIREGKVRGKHTVQYESVLDSMTLEHKAHTRDAFAFGALLAASFIQKRKGVFGMKDLLNL